MIVVSVFIATLLFSTGNIFIVAQPSCLYPSLGIFPPEFPCELDTILGNGFPGMLYTKGLTNAAFGTQSIVVDAFSADVPAIAAYNNYPVMIVQMQGVTIQPFDNDDYGSNNGTGKGFIDGTLQAGYYDFNVIQMASTTTQDTEFSLLLYTPLLHSYFNNADENKQYQVIIFPPCSEMRISSNVQVPPWNGAIGGILPIIADQITINATLIDASGRGFRGGKFVEPATTDPPSNDHVTICAAGFGNSEKGEGIAGQGPQGTFDEVTYPNDGGCAKGAPGNAGGGGNNFLGGGGGGSNAGSGEDAHDGTTTSSNGLGAPSIFNFNATSRFAFLGTSNHCFLAPFHIF